MKMDKNYDKGRLCPLCGQPITNRSRFCRSHAKEFKKWLKDRYGKSVKVPKRKGPGGAKVKGERRRQQILDMLEYGSLSTTELAKELGITRDGVLHQMHVLEKSNSVEREKDGHSVVWRKIKT